MYRPESLPLNKLESYVIDVFASLPHETLYQTDVHKLVDPAVLTSDPQRRIVTKYQLKKALAALVDAGQLHRREETSPEKALRQTYAASKGGGTAYVYSLDSAIPALTAAHFTCYGEKPTPRGLPEPKGRRKKRQITTPVQTAKPQPQPEPVTDIDPRVRQAINLLTAFAGEKLEAEVISLRGDLAAANERAADLQELVNDRTAQLANARSQLKAIQQALTAVHD